MLSASGRISTIIYFFCNPEAQLRVQNRCAQVDCAKGLKIWTISVLLDAFLNDTAVLSLEINSLRYEDWVDCAILHCEVFSWLSNRCSVFSHATFSRPFLSSEDLLGTFLSSAPDTCTWVACQSGLLQEFLAHDCSSMSCLLQSCIPPGLWIVVKQINKHVQDTNY